MKKLVYVLACAVAVTAFVSCGNNTKSPSADLKNATEKFKDGNYDGFVEIISYDKNMPSEAVKQQKAADAAVLRKNVQAKAQAKGGLKNVNVKSENVANDGKTAQVVMTNEYNNGDKEDLVYNMVLENDVWKVRTGADKEVWRTRTADGREVTMKLKDEDNRDVFKENFDGDTKVVKEKHEDGRDVYKVKDGDDKEVVKVIDKGDKEVIKKKENGEKTVTEIEK